MSMASPFATHSIRLANDCCMGSVAAASCPRSAATGTDCVAMGRPGQPRRRSRCR